MPYRFKLNSWGAWPPRLSSETKLAAIRDQSIAFAPNHLKRRLSPLAKTVFAAIAGCGHVRDCPAVFSSTHGELAASLEMIELLEAGEEISPTGFSLSVHNAIAGLFSMAVGNTAEIAVIGPGEEGIAAGFIEAIGMLSEGASAVLVVFYDEPLPAFYPAQPFLLSTDQRCAVALKISKQGAGLAMRFSRDEPRGQEGEQPWQLPRLVDFICGPCPRLQIKTPRQSWVWQKS